MQEFEPFVSADAVADFLSLSRRFVIELAREGAIPSHPVDGRGRGARRTYRFKLSEVNAWLLKRRA